MNIREKIEKNEKLILNPFATYSINTKGRKILEKDDDFRTCYMIDRDRIIHSKSFRRLKVKSQVYIKTLNDHYRTRLTHTLEVCQVARTIGKAIGLNEDLIEAIALGHDIGHGPFAHTGEEVLNELLPGGFMHNKNSIRVLTKIENDGKGLNLTTEVLNGILYHSGFGLNVSNPMTLEGQVVKYSDKIAYVNHDIDDSIRAGLLKEKDLPMDIIKILGENHNKRINNLIIDCINKTLENISKNIVKVELSLEIEEALSNLRRFMFKKIYKGNILKLERDKAKFILRHVYEYFYNKPEQLPDFYKNIVLKEGLHQGVADYIAGMSDEYCLRVFNDIYVPKCSTYII
ncbi:deoxyguanosinetriphosphate triphosphohydrolase [Clostridium senegalense]|uniref:deoxyguanosinetriphosphate triphosphohydrolase n=1 Tax=Clostridium senegalense TaxID=1465809 RepID=UPI000289295A|nr:deoxyguanosinetriphosphate triphosphohydrolase [Clostridium senegalense]MBU5225453.1 deoxyguanosinetriphosphate triphosphohydrolase [Clostridium senegalense]